MPGCDDYAAKPIDRKKLIELIAGYLKKPQSSIQAAKAVM
jgi:hypothetical protein